MSAARKGVWLLAFLTHARSDGDVDGARDGVFDAAATSAGERRRDERLRRWRVSAEREEM